MTQNESKEVKIKFIFEAIDETIIKSNFYAKLVNVFKYFSDIIGIKFDSLYFLYNGQKIDDFQKTFFEVANGESRQNMEMTILVYKKDESINNNEDSINLFISDENNTQKIKCKRNDKIENIIKKYENNAKLNNKSIIYKYKGISLDLEKSFDYSSKLEKDFFKNVYKKNLIYIIFIYLNIKYTIKCYKEDKIEDIFSDFASKNNISKNKIIFKYKDNLIEQNQTLNQFINNNNIINIKEIAIDVLDTPPISHSFFSIHKIKKIIILSISSVIIVSTSIVLSKSDEPTDIPTTDLINCQPGYKLKDDECVIDYFIEATYSSNANEKIKLISDNFNLNKIRQMIIDEKEVNPTKIYAFNEIGKHKIKFSFFPLKNGTINDKIGIFDGIKNLLNVEFSNYSEDCPDVSFYSMFNNCINLITVDLSNFFENYTFYYRFPHENYGLLDYMFNNCSNLKLVTFPIKYRYYLFIRGAKYMFNNCISLTSINITAFNYINEFGLNVNKSFNFNNMFSNCISLKYINFGSHGYITSSSASNLSYMFYNCSSLTSIDLSGKFNSILFYANDISYIFAFCSHLKEFVIDVVQATQLKNMSNAFRNCSSLYSVNITIFPQSIEDMSFLFFGCTSLTHIEFYMFRYFFLNIKYMNNMFYDCYSLKSLKNLGIYNANPHNVDYITENLKDLSYMFSGCFSLTSINLSKITTKKITNYEGLFYNCEKLEYIDISTFTHNNLSDSNLSIFNSKKPLNGIIYLNSNFYNRVKIPSTLKVEINNTYL